MCSLHVLAGLLSVCLASEANSTLRPSILASGTVWRDDAVGPVSAKSFRAVFRNMNSSITLGDDVIVLRSTSRLKSDYLFWDTSTSVIPFTGKSYDLSYLDEESIHSMSYELSDFDVTEPAPMFLQCDL